MPSPALRVHAVRAIAVAARAYAEGAEIDAVHRLERLAADAGREEHVLALVGERDRGCDVAHEQMVHARVREGPGEPGLARSSADQGIDAAIVEAPDVERIGAGDVVEVVAGVAAPERAVDDHVPGFVRE